MSAKEDLLKGAEYIEKYGWTQKSFGTFSNRGEHGPACLMGACAAADGKRALYWDKGRYSGVVTCFRAAHAGTSPIEWNDVVGRTKDEVVAAMRLAAEKCE